MKTIYIMPELTPEEVTQMKYPPVFYINRKSFLNQSIYKIIEKQFRKVKAK